MDDYFVVMVYVNQNLLGYYWHLENIDFMRQHVK
jgi:hypothetical protein